MNKNTEKHNELSLNRQTIQKLCKKDKEKYEE